MKQFFLAALFCMLSIFTQAQKNQYRAYYITTRGDTSRGVVLNFTEWERSPDQIQFKSDADQATITLTPGNCKQLTLDKLDTYLGYKGTRLSNAATLSSFGNESDSTSRYDTIECFLRVVFKSNPYTIALHKDNKRENFYIILGDREPEELLYKVYLTGTGLAEAAIFRQQLVKIFADSLASNPKMLELLGNTRYTEKDLAAFMRGITHTKKVATEDGAKRGEFVLMAGAAINFFDVTPKNSNSAFAQTDYGTAVSPVLSVAYIYYTNRRFGNVFLSPQLRYFYSSHSGVHTKEVTSGIHHNTFKASFLYLGFSLGKNWVNKKSVKWYTSVGYGATAIINLSHTETIEQPGRATTTEKRSDSRLSGNFFLQTGVVLKQKYGCWIGYKPPTNLDNFVNFKTPFSSLQFGIEYRL